MAKPNHANSVSEDGINTDVGEILAKRFGGVSIYAVLMLILAVGIVWSGVKVAEQVQQYHQDYKTLQDMRKQYRKLQIENQRLLIEQQTFSATPQIASRAVAELGMFSPTTADKMVVQPKFETNTSPAVAISIPESENTSPSTLHGNAQLNEVTP